MGLQVVSSYGSKGVRWLVPQPRTTLALWPSAVTDARTTRRSAASGRPSATRGSRTLAGFRPQSGSGSASAGRAAGRMATNLDIPFGQRRCAVGADGVLYRPVGGQRRQARLAGVHHPLNGVRRAGGLAGLVVEPGSLAQPLEGQCRPGHFRGVATVVLKLFNMASADVAYFGQKDYQQALVIRQMVRELDLPIEIRVCPIVREPDGLALSSRNHYLSPGERQQAACLHKALQEAVKMVEAGERNAESVRRAIIDVINAHNLARIDYVNIVETEGLTDVDTLDGEVLIAVAAYVGTTRLIDNEILRL